MTSLDELPSVSVVVPTRARPELLRSCLESLVELDYPSDRYEILVIEDGTESGRAVAEQLRGRSPATLRYERVPRGGAAAAYAAGLREARHDVVAFLDDDALAPPTWLRQIAANLVRGKPDGVIGTGGRISGDYPLDRFEAAVATDGTLHFTGFGLVSTPPCDVDHLPGSNMAFWRDALLSIGGFDCRFSRTMSWRHETDVCVRLRQRGHRLLYDPGLTVVHRGARWTSGLARLDPAIVWSTIRDDAYFRTKNFGLSGAVGAMKAGLRGSAERLLHGAAMLLLVLVELIAWIPGAVRGLAARRHAG